MVKHWIPSRRKATEEASSSSPMGATRVGIRASRMTKFGGNLLASLHQRIVKRPKPQAITAAQPPNEAPLAPVSVSTTSSLPPSTWGMKQPTAPKPPPGSDDEESDESEDGQGGVEGGEGQDVAKKPEKKKKSKRTSLGFNRWVPKLLNPVEKHRDKVHRKKKKHLLALPQGPPVIFTNSKTPYIVLLARILGFLDPLEPARVTTYVNKSTAAGVRAFYDLYCPPPRPRRYLVNRLLENRQSVFAAKLMELLPIHDRVRASASCFSFYEACNALPLEFENARTVQRFLVGFGFPQTSRIHKRFGKTPALLFNEADAVDVANVIQLLERGSDGENDDPDDDSDCFAAVKQISLRKVTGLSAGNGKYFEQLLQTLFMDHVNSRLQTLELIDLSLEDLQFKHLARLWRDAHFPALRRLSLANNAFSSRYMRDWTWSFENERFLEIEAVDVSNAEMTNHDLQRLIACLPTTPALRSLTISHNLCSFATIHKLRKMFESKALSALRELHCNEIPHRGLLRLNETLARGNCKELHELNLSRNAELKAIASFLDLIRGEGLPSLTVLQVGYAQTRAEGHALVQDTLRRRSVQELRRLKQLRFEERLTAIQLENDVKAERDQLRCRRQSQRLREVYDHLENEADRALRRRKQLKKSSQLHIHQEIMRQKQQRTHARLSRQLDLDVHAA
ncbi:hypothetical protein PR003_g22254 [Phytophthora rubi]|uniref:Uncharacterized protein n=1 Tax=Phytophthora rubi TaxID=129364 RepID=A0A6A4D775_9STRA|nr:hypothetical protein PR003_g22254 [Phytophthora rubi]